MRWLQLRELSSSIANLSPLSERLSVAASECLTHAYNRGSESYTSRQGEPHGATVIDRKAWCRISRHVFAGICWLRERGRRRGIRQQERRSTRHRATWHSDSLRLRT